jgi:NADP-dependent 3-hydroxy acid dehydrogenase YdfG
VLALARQGCNVLIAAKSTESQPNLPGNIYSVAREAEALGVEALPYQLDLRDAARCTECVQAAVDKWGRIDVLVNNASALWWQKMVDTPIKKFDLITGINTRGAFFMAQACMPHMLRQRFGRVVTMSPPISSDFRLYDGMTAYNISKVSPPIAHLTHSTLSSPLRAPPLSASPTSLGTLNCFTLLDTYCAAPARPDHACRRPSPRPPPALTETAARV